MDDSIPEIFEMILDNFMGYSELKPTLKACSLVSRIWHCHSLPRVFRAITVDGSHAERNFPAFIELLENSGIAAGVVKLRLMSCGAEAHATCIYQLSSILASLPSLRYLSLEKLMLPIFQAEDLDCVFRAPASDVPLKLRRLKIEGLCATSAMVFSVLNLFESIAYFRVGYLYSIPNISSADDATMGTAELLSILGSMPQISTLRLIYIPEDIRSSFLGRFFQQRSLEAVARGIGVSASYKLEDVLSPGDRIRAGNLSAVRLDLDIQEQYKQWGLLSSENIPARSWDCLHLSSHTSLSSPTLYVVTGDGTYSTPAHVGRISWAAFFNIFSTAPRTLRHLSIDLSSMIHHLEELRLARVEASLERFVALEDLTIRIYVPARAPFGEQAKVFVKAKLRGLDEAGKLRMDLAAGWISMGTQ